MSTSKRKKELLGYICAELGRCEGEILKYFQNSFTLVSSQIIEIHFITFTLLEAPGKLAKLWNSGNLQNYVIFPSESLCIFFASFKLCLLSFFYANLSSEPVSRFKNGNTVLHWLPSFLHGCSQLVLLGMRDYSLRLLTLWKISRAQVSFCS